MRFLRLVLCTLGIGWQTKWSLDMDDDLWAVAICPCGDQWACLDGGRWVKVG